MKLKAGIFTVSMLLVGPGMAQAQDVLLRLSPENGLVTEYQVSSSFWLVADIFPQANPDTPFIHQQGSLTQTVTASDGNTATIRTVFGSLQMTLPPGLGISPPEIEGMAVSVTMNSRGRVLESSVDQGTVPPTLRGFEEQIRQLVAGMAVNLPEAPVAIGSSWSSSLNETVAGPVGPMLTRNDARYTLQGVERDDGRRVATIGLEGTLSQRSDTASGQPTLMSVDLNGNVTGEIQIDLDLGRVVRFVNSSNLEGELLMGNSPNGIPIVVRTEMKLELAGS